MLSKVKIKLIKSLADKKNRQSEGLFLAEGNKLVKEILNSHFTVNTLIATDQFIEDYGRTVDCEIISADQEEIDRASLLKSPQQAIALVQIPAPIQHFSLTKNLTLCLDDLQDPGNLGTIVRLADWFGIRQIICSENTVDIYNPKAVQATMGAICRVNISYTGLKDLIKKAKSENLTIYGAFQNGTNIYMTDLQQEALVILGNEGNGISRELESGIDEKISIPCFSLLPVRTESLNVSMAAAIICSEFKRRTVPSGNVPTQNGPTW